MNGFEVMSHQCQSCIYRKDSPLDLEALENQVRSQYGDFSGYRICHSQADDGKKASCRGFWDRHKDAFQVGQIAQRLNAVIFVEPGKR